MMEGVSLVVLLTCISICSGSPIGGDEEGTLLVIANNMFQKVENISSQLQEHDGMMQNMTEGMKDILTQLELGLESTREVLPSEPLQDVINSALKNGLQEILQDENFRCVAPPTAAISSPRMYKKEIPSEPGKFYCSLDVDGKLAKGSCYLLSSATVTWSIARDKCIQMGADLVKIETEEEFTFLEKLTVGDTWIGLTDQKVEGQYMWVVDGSLHVPSHFDSMWKPGEPNNDYEGREDCIHFWHSYHLLNDGVCDNEHRFICELLYKEVLL